MRYLFENFHASELRSSILIKKTVFSNKFFLDRYLYIKHERLGNWGII